MWTAGRRYQTYSRRTAPSVGKCHCLFLKGRSVNAVWGAADLCLLLRGVTTVSGENGNCVDRKAESTLSTVSCVATHTHTHTHDSARYKTICPQFALSSDR
jgi:hypothetical protein